MEQAQVKKTKTFSTLQSLVITALLAALVIVLQIVGGIPAGPFNITLTLVPIVVGAILLGWQYGLFLGVVFGVVVSILSITGRDAGGLMVFQANPVMGWVICVGKGAAAGFFPALIYKLFTRFKYAPHFFMSFSGAFLLLGGFALGKLAAFDRGWKLILTVLVALVLAAVYMLLAYRALKSGNTAVYLAAMVAPIANTGIFIIGMSIFYRSLLETWAGGTSLAVFILGGLIGLNFLIEFTVAVLLSPAIAAIVKAAKKQK